MISWIQPNQTFYYSSFLTTYTCRRHNNNYIYIKYVDNVYLIFFTGKEAVKYMKEKNSALAYHF